MSEDAHHRPPATVKFQPKLRSWSLTYLSVTKKSENKPNCVLLGLAYSVMLISCRDA
jgi:hypothetical protein